MFHVAFGSIPTTPPPPPPSPPSPSPPPSPPPLPPPSPPVGVAPLVVAGLFAAPLDVSLPLHATPTQSPATIIGRSTILRVYERTRPAQPVRKTCILLAR